MKKDTGFVRTTLALAAPVTLQSMLQASFSIVDQVMIGQLGSVSVAGVGLAGRFSSIFTVLISAVATIASIMASQYMGQDNRRELRRSFWINCLLSCGVALLFTLLCLSFSSEIMGLYARDEATVAAAASYLRITALGFLPTAAISMISMLFRCMEKAALPLYAGIVSALLNTGLNAVLIFGKFGFPAMGAEGAALATLISQCIGFGVLTLLFWKHRSVLHVDSRSLQGGGRFNWRQYGMMLLPLLVCELMWSLGENVYAAIYGHLGTSSCAAMTLINPVQSLMIGALCGLSQAAGVIVGKRLGNGEYDSAYDASRKLMICGLMTSLCLSALLFALRGAYVKLYRVEPEVRELACQILLAYALVAPFKVLNMILGGGILRSGGKTNYTMAIDLIGTWLLGVPLGLISAFVLHLEIPYVYFILSLEECVRFGISLLVFRGRKWMRVLDK